jgi:hypothetical protein
MWCFLGLFAVIFVIPRADGAGLRRLGRAWAGVFVAAGAAYAAINSIASLSYSHATPDLVRHALPKYMMRRFQEEADFPGREIAATITRRWHETVGTPLAYLVGKKWIAGNVSFFSADHPLVLRDGDVGSQPQQRRRPGRQPGARLSHGGDAAAAAGALAQPRQPAAATHPLGHRPPSQPAAAAQRAGDVTAA